MTEEINEEMKLQSGDGTLYKAASQVYNFAGD